MTEDTARETTVKLGPGASGQGRPPRSIDLLYTETETELRSAVRSLLDDKAAWRDVLARTETGQTYDDKLWHTLAAEVGCAGLLIPEEHGGAGASYREAAVVAEELGRTVAPVPFLGSAVIATAALLAAGDTTFLPELASGTITATLAVPFASRPYSAAGQQRPEPTVRLDAPEPGDGPGDYRLTGTVTAVADALPADVLLIPADSVPYALYAVLAGAPGVGKRPLVSLDMTRQLCEIRLDQAPARQVAVGPAAEQAVAAGLLAGAGILASEQFGLAEMCLGTTVGYVQGTAPVRPAGGRLPGDQAPARRPVGAGHAGARGGQERGRLARGRDRAGDRARGRAGQGGVLRCGAEGGPGDDPAARRDRLHLGAPGAPVPQAREGRLARAGHRRRAPGVPRSAG